MAFLTSSLHLFTFTMAEAQNIHERTSAPSAQETSVRKKNAKEKLEISSVLLGRDRSVLSWWHEEKKMEATTHSTSYSLRSVRLSVCLSSLSLSLSLSLSPSLSDYWVRISSFLSGSCVWTLPWLLSWTENRENFLQLEKKTCLQLLELISREGTEKNCCYYRNVMNVFIFHQKEVYML